MKIFLIQNNNGQMNFNNNGKKVTTKIYILNKISKDQGGMKKMRYSFNTIKIVKFL